MKIGILTQPLKNNYGGILQAYALQRNLKDMGHDPWIINRVTGKKIINKKLSSIGKKISESYLPERKAIHASLQKFIPVTEKEKKLIAKHTSSFVNKYMHPVTEPIDNDESLKELSKDGFEAFVVGSDQVWRTHYSPCITNYYLDFIQQNKDIIRIAYAASFGLTDWHYSEQLTQQVSQLARQFNAISVREDSGVKLCSDYLDVDAQHLIDPTMLLNKEHYLNILQIEKTNTSPGNLKTYFLDKNDDSEVIVDKVSKALKLKPFKVMPKERNSRKIRSKIENYIFPPVTQWLKGFADAEFVVTDSFHGCVFSIIFNVPFIAIGNVQRGVARFHSLLGLLGIENRLVLTPDAVTTDLINQAIDWKQVNEKIKSEQKKSEYFLKNHLK